MAIRSAETRTVAWCHLIAMVWLAMLTGCSGDPMTNTAPVRQWRCPANWVPYERGGCGPAVLLCVPGGGAAPGACNGIDLSRPPMLALPDGGTVRGFYRLPDGGIGGGWPEPGDPDGPPAEDWAPDAGIATCPAGWQRLADGTCDPVLRADCPAGSAALPGGTCTPTSERDCPAGEYADLGVEAMGARVVHVRAGADTAAADGSAARPYATILEGVTRAGHGGWVRVAAGEYGERIALASGWTAHVVGVCAARVTLRGPGPAQVDAATVSTSGARTALDLRGVTVTGEGLGLVAGGGSTLRARATVVTGNVGVGVLADGPGAQVELTASLVRGTRPNPGGMYGHGLNASRGATLRASGVVVADNTEAGVLALSASTTVELASCVVRGTHPRPNGTGGIGLDVNTGATLRAASTVVIDNAENGVLVGLPGTRAELSESIIRGTRPRPNGTWGRGLQVQMGATLRATGVLVVDNTDTGVLAAGSGAVVELTASVVRGTRPRADGSPSAGLYAIDGAVVRASGVLAADNARSGFSVVGAGTQVELSSCVVRGTRPDRGRSNGLSAEGGSNLRVVDSLLADNPGTEVVASGKGTVVAVSSSVLRDTSVLPGEGSTGSGLSAFDGATLRADRVYVARSGQVGAAAQDPGTRLEIVSSVVRETRLASLRNSGAGLWASFGATLQVTGALIADSTDVGVATFGESSRVELTASAIRRTRSRPNGTHGNGLLVQADAVLHATGVLLADNLEAGVSVYDRGAAQLSDLLVVNVSPSARGLGVGLYTSSGGQTEGTRVALQGVRGAGVMANPFQGVDGARGLLRDLFVREVRSGTVRFSEDDVTLRPEGRAVAYGLHTGPGCTIEASRAVFDNGGFGFYNASGVVRITEGVIARQQDAAGAFSLGTAPSANGLTNVSLRDNNSDAVAQRSDLPAASSLPAPPPVCPPEGCM